MPAKTPRYSTDRQNLPKHSGTERRRMSANVGSEQLCLGFMATLELEGRGHVGGLLVTNQSGRPLEFQCTTPVNPDRTQKILYGPTLLPWLLGEVIGGTLLKRVAIKPEIVVIRDLALLELRNHTETPVVCVTPNIDSEDSESDSQSLGRHRLRFHAAHQGDSEILARQIHLVPGQADLEEPLDRVHEALGETVKTVLAR